MVWPAPRCRTCWQRVLSCSFIGLNRRLYNAVALSLQDRFGVHTGEFNLPLPSQCSLAGIRLSVLQNQTLILFADLVLPP